jgi:N-acetylmuramoyl-L-alanine amidase
MMRGMFLAAALCPACLSCADAPAKTTASPVAAPAIIALDVGHSKAHPGAISARGVTEFEFNAHLARTISASLAPDKAQIRLIGAEGDADNLFQRTALARAAHAQLLLSIHHDSVKPEYLKPWTWNGAEHRYADGRFTGFGLFVSRKNPYLQQSLRCASAIGFKLQEAGFRHSTYHADPVLGESREWADEQNGVYYYDDLVVLKTASQPALLLEAGVIVNRDEEAQLTSPEVREKIARAVRAGLQSCGMAGGVSLQAQTE